MKESILIYQKAFNSIIERFKNIEDVLAVMVFGSMVTGNLWQESDLDLFVIVSNSQNDMRNVYTEEKGIPVHIRLINKKKFIQLYNDDLKGGFNHRIFASSRLVFSKDKEITATYDSGRYYPDKDRERWNMVYLGNVIKKLGICKKYLYNDSIYTAYTYVVSCVKEYAKLYVNFYGYMISKDTMVMAMNLDDKFNLVVQELFFNNSDTKKVLENTINFIEASVEKNIKEMASFLINFIGNEGELLSADDIKENQAFKGFNIEFEEILAKLCEKKLINKDSRDIRTGDNKLLFKEKVYFL